MRVTTIALLLVLISFSCVQAQNENLTHLCWSDSLLLEWKNFKAPENSTLNIAAVSEIVLPYTLRSDGEVDFTLLIQTCFVPEKSWYKHNANTKVLLLHEQLHFDIAELHRRITVSYTHLTLPTTPYV